MSDQTAPGEEPWHHPSARGGMHDWFNHVAFSLAMEHGLQIIDVTPVTVAMSLKPGWRQRYLPSPTFQGSDLYHWYDNKLLWGHVSKEALSLCSGGTSLRPRNSVSQS